MTQKNIYVMDVIVDKLANGAKLSKALNEVYNKRRISIPYNEGAFNVSVRDLGLSNRSANSLLRARLQKLEDVINFCKGNPITNISNLGKTSGTEIFEVILDYSWDHMDEKERTLFLIDTVKRNSKYIRAEIFN